MSAKLLGFLLLLVASGCGGNSSDWTLHGGETAPAASEPDVPAAALQDPRRRVLISTDIGGDNDDTQSLIHALLYSDEIRIEGIVCGAPTGNCAEAHQVIEHYAADYPTLTMHSAGYPTPEQLRTIVRQGSTSGAPPSGFSSPTPGSNFIVETALRNDAHQLIVVVWGSITDLAQAIHDAPQIKPRILVYSIGGWNTRQDPASFNYLRTSHPDFVWVHSDSTNEGIFLTGLGDESRYGNIGFVREIIQPAGNLGKLFYEISADINVNQYGIKMGDTPSFLFALRGDFSTPFDEGWGGRFCHNGGNYWSDCTDEELKLHGRFGAQTVADFREEFLTDFEARLARLNPPS